MWSGQGPALSTALQWSNPKGSALPGSVYWSLCAQKAQVKVLGGLRRLHGEKA